MAPSIILAVGIGNSGNNKLIKTPQAASGVRPYIKGLINWLENQGNPPAPDVVPNKYMIGDTNAYVIDYRECDENQLQNTVTASADVVLCMSTTVAREAVKYTKDVPIVAIVSEPGKEGFPARVCGVSAKRSQHAMDQYQQFVAKLKAKGLPFKNIYALHKVGFSPSDDAKGWLGNKVAYVNISPSADIQTQIRLIPRNADGLMILPADRFFGAADNIVQWAEHDRNLPTFWSVPDWPTGAFGGYGFSQELCGQYLAERVAQIWTSQGNIPSPPFTLVDEKWIRGKRTQSSGKKPARRSRKK